MADSERPIIIKRKKVVAGGGHHGGAWKVAYADFVTAMMAFFMLMWLLNATTENQRKGLADYFNPTIPVSRSSGGGEQALSGSSAFEQDDLAKVGKGGLGEAPGVVQEALGTDGDGDGSGDGGRQAEDIKLEEAAKVVLGLGGESLVEEMALRQVLARVTDEGLVVEFFDVEGSPLFLTDGSPSEALLSLIDMTVRVSNLIENDLAVAGHTRAQPIVAAQDTTWDTSTGRADRVRALLGERGLRDQRIARITGHADHDLAEPDAPLSIRNNRLEIVFLRNGA